MTGAFTIRRALPEDTAAVGRELAAYLDYIGDTLDPEGLDHDIAHWQEEYDGRTGVLLLVVDPTGEVVGTAAVRVLEAKVAELKRMWLRPAARGQARAQRLLEACLDESRRLGCQMMRLDSQAKLAAAVKLYRANGFREIPPYNDNPRADIWMERALAQ
jgi:GNAT superfamily N-acetyltransferase